MSILYIQIDSDSDLKEAYERHIRDHNHKVDNNICADSGFDLYISCSSPIMIPKSLSNCFDLKIKACAISLDDNKPKGFYIYPRSCVNLTPLRLCNSVGIINSGYRDRLKCYFDCHDTHVIHNMQRLVQVCMSDLKPFKVMIVDDISILGNSGI